jgi:hypothetical protein
MNAIKSKSRVKHVQAMMYQLEEYRDPTGSNLPPWGEPYNVSESICQKFGLDPYSLMLYQAADNSNFQSFPVGSVCIIDTSHRTMRDGMRYLIQHPQGARIRRAFIGHDSSVTLCPDVANPNFRPEIVPAASVPLIKAVGWVACVLIWGS